MKRTLLFLGLAFIFGFSTAARAQERYGFEDGTQGWEIAAVPSPSALQSISSSAAQAHTGNRALLLSLNSQGVANGEVFVDMQNHPPYGVAVPVDLSGREVSLYVWCPAGTPRAIQLQLFVKDSEFKSEYGAAYSVVPNSWVLVRLVPTSTTPAGGFKQQGFDPRRIRLLGVKVSAPLGQQRQLYLDSVRFSAAQPAVPAIADEQYGFEQNYGGFVASNDPNTQAIIAAERTTDLAALGAASLRLKVELRGDEPPRQAGEVQADLLQSPPFRLDAPLNLDGKEISLYVFCPAGLRGQGKPNGLQVFVKDDQFRSEYGTWTPVREGYWMKLSLTPSIEAPPDGFKQEGFNPQRVRIIGLKLAAGDAQASFNGFLYLDGLAFPSNQSPLQNLRYSFGPNKEGWQHETYADLPGVVSVEQAAEFALEGQHSLRLNLRVANRAADQRTYGAAYADMRDYPPAEVRAPFNLEGQLVEAYVYCPPGSQSQNPRLPNQVRLFVKDQNFKAAYSAPFTMLDGQWVRIKLMPSSTLPSEGYRDVGFNAAAIRVIGVDVGMSGSYDGPLYVDHVSFPAAPQSLPLTDHGYHFDSPESQQSYPHWGGDPSWNARAWSTVAPGSGALVAEANFRTTTNETRKGVFTISFNPPLNLTTKDHLLLQAKLRFEPPVEGLLCFRANFAVFDKLADKWVNSPLLPVGGSGWNYLQFDLAQATPAVALADIGGVALQLYANCEYRGRVLLDDVVIGGREKPGIYRAAEGGYVRRVGTQFVCDSNPFYFAGANAEYLCSRSGRIVAQVLDSAAALQLRALRTWAFHEGQDYSFQPQRGAWNQMAFEHLDRIVAEAGHRNIRLVLALVDNWGHNGGMPKYMEWVRAEHPESLPQDLQTPKPGDEQCLHDQFYVNEYAKRWYKEFVKHLLTRRNSVTGKLWSEDSTILAFEIVNEPRCESDPSGRLIHAWVREMSDYVHSLAPNHLIACGQEGGYITTYEEANKRAYQSFPQNYWQYGLRWTEETQKLCHTGVAGADFLSDHSSTPRTVCWQSGTQDAPGTIQCEERPGIPNVDFTTFRLYVDEREYNLYRTNHNGFDQRKEWMSEHQRDAHETLNKPVVLGEFGIKVSGWTYNGAFGQQRFVPIPRYTPKERAEVFRQYFEHIEATGINGSFFWNLGYPRMFEERFDDCDALGTWVAGAESDAQSPRLNTEKAFIQQGIGSLQLHFDSTSGVGKAFWDKPGLKATWNVAVENGQPRGANRTKVILRVYNPGAPLKLALAVSTGPQLTWHEAPEQLLDRGWQTLTFDLSASHWKSAAANWQHNESLEQFLADVRRVSIGVWGYTTSGRIFVDDLTTSRDDGFVIYPSDPLDPVTDVIRQHAASMNRK